MRGKEEIDLTYSGSDAPRGQEATVRIPSGRCKPGDALYRLTDAVQMAEIRAIMAQENVHIPLQATLTAMPGRLPVLELRDPDGHAVRAVGEQIVDHAQQRALDQESAKKQLAKMGGTPYALESLTLHSEQAFMTAGMLNSLRRDALAAMKAARTQGMRVAAKGQMMPADMPAQQKLLIAQSERLADAKTLLACGADVFYWAPQVMTPSAIEEALAQNPEVKPVLVLPAVAGTEELHDLHACVCFHATRFAGVVANNVGQFERQWPVDVFGGQGLNVMNGESAGFFTALGAKRLTASCELSEKELRELQACGGNYELEAYGRVQLMLLSHCPRRTKAGEERQDAACNACAADGGCPQVYTDRKGYRFPLRRQRMAHGCVVRLYNSVPTDMSRFARRLHDMGVSLRVSFTDEPLERQKEIVSSYRSILDSGVAVHDVAELATSGHLARGVE